MSDPLRTENPHTLEPVSAEMDREAKIEQLLLAGLEHYFSAQYDQAINVWTRALFLDRAHARARAYIERARSAQAERQRESEELLQRGVTAFKQGEGEEARRLLRDAMDQGAPQEEALVILERLNRLAQVSPPATTVPRQRTSPPIGRAPQASRAAWVALSVLVLVTVAAVAFAAGVFRANGRPLLDRSMPGTLATVHPGVEDSLPLPRRGELALSRARSFVQSGRLRDALAALDAVRPTDPQRPDADRLRADVQKQLIALSRLSPDMPAFESPADTPAP
jgi:tetratricopeptide (TPR) repeat protein